MRWLSRPGGTPLSPGARPWRLDPWLLIFLAAGLILRCLYLDLPMAEAHRWRQITNADIARNFYEGSLNIFRPQVSWGGPGNALVGMEFPLLQWLAGVLFHLTSNITLVCRGISIAFSLGTVGAIYGLGTRLYGRPAGRAAAFLLALSPSFVFFGRTFISDVPMVFFSVAAIWGFVAYADTGDRRAAAWGTVCAALACLVKIPAVIIFAPIAWLAWTHRRWRALLDPIWIAGVALPLIATVLWYWYADVLFHQTGLGQAIWHSSGGYAPSVSIAAGPFTGISHWSTLDQIRDPEFYKLMVIRAWNLHLTPPGFALALVGWLVYWNSRRRIAIDLWFGSAVLFILVSAEGNRNHEFHQLPALPPAALFFGMAAAPAFDGAWLRRWAGIRFAPALALAALLTIGLIGFAQSEVIRDFYRPDRLDWTSIHAGQAIEAVVPRNETVIVVEYEKFGGNSPMVLFWAHRKGWSFDMTAITPHVVERLRRQYKARYFATTMWPEIEARQPVLADYLRAQKRLPVDVTGTAVFEIY